MKNCVETIIEDLTFLQAASEKEKNLIGVIAYGMAITVAETQLPAIASLQSELHKAREEREVLQTKNREAKEAMQSVLDFQEYEPNMKLSPIQMLVHINNYLRDKINSL